MLIALSERLTRRFSLMGEVSERVMEGIVQSGDFEVQSSHESADEIRTALAANEPATSTPVEDPPAPDVADSPGEPSKTPMDPPAPDQGERDPKTGQFKPKAPGKPRNDAQARIDQVIAQQRAAERRAEAAERERDELRARSQPAKPEPPAAPKPQPQVQGDPNDPEPDPENLQAYPDGQFDRKYMRDMAGWVSRQEYKAAEMARRRYAQQDAEQRELETHATKFSERLASAETADPGFMDRVHPKLANAKPTSALGPDEKPTFANFLAEQVFRSEHPRELMLHLSDEREVQRLATLPPLQVVRDLAMFEARLGAAPSPAASAPAAISHAKAPIQPLGSSPSVTDTNAFSEELSVEENIRRGNRREGRALPRGL